MINYLKSKYIFLLVMNFLLILLFIYFSLIRIDYYYFLSIFITANLVLSVYILINGYLITKHKKDIDYLISNIDELHLVAATIQSNELYEAKLLSEYLEIYSKKFYNLYQKEVVSNQEYEDYIILLVHDIKNQIQNIKLATPNIDTKPLEHLCQRILITSKVNHFNFENNLTRVDISFVISNILRDYFDLCYEKITVEVNISTQFLICDEYWIAYMLRQLIDNGVKYTNDLLKIDVDINSISVITNGKLLTNHDKTHITKRGYRGINSNFKSSGYGLYLISTICDHFNYQLMINNEQVNEFKIILKSS